MHSLETVTKRSRTSRNKSSLSDCNKPVVECAQHLLQIKSVVHTLSIDGLFIPTKTDRISLLYYPIVSEPPTILAIESNQTNRPVLGGMSKSVPISKTSFSTSKSIFNSGLLSVPSSQSRLGDGDTSFSMCIGDTTRMHKS